MLHKDLATFDVFMFKTETVTGIIQLVERSFVIIKLFDD